jgi:hypothetical protein
MAVVHTLAHFEYFSLRLFGVSLAAEYFDADFLELVTDVSVACCITSPR